MSFSTKQTETFLPVIYLFIILTKLLQAQQIGGGGAVLLRRFEYKHSFRVPNLAQRDGTIPVSIA